MKKVIYQGKIVFTGTVENCEAWLGGALGHDIEDAVEGDVINGVLTATDTQPIPKTEETTPVTEETTPVVEETTPVTEETTPVVEETKTDVQSVSAPVVKNSILFKVDLYDDDSVKIGRTEDGQFNETEKLEMNTEQFKNILDFISFVS